MSSLPLLTLVGHVALSTTLLTVLTNTLLIYLTIHHVKQISRAYKLMIIMQAQIGALFALCELFVRPFLHSYNASFTYFSMSKMLGASKFLKSLLLLGYSMIYQVIICFMAIQFVYRKIVIRGGKGMVYFKGWRVVYWLLYMMVFSVIWSVAVYSSQPTEYSMNYIRSVMREEYGMEDMEELSGFVIVMYESDQSTFQFTGVLFELGTSTVLVSQYIVMIYCGLIIHKEIGSLISVTSAKKHRIQSQLFLTLLLQIIAPCLFHHIPALLLYYAPVMNWKVSYPSGVVICLFVVYPTIDSWILMTVVTEYRRAMRARSNILFDPYTDDFYFPQPIVTPMPSEYHLFKIQFSGQPELLYESWQRELWLPGRFEYWKLFKRHLEAEQRYQLEKGWIVLVNQDQMEDEGIEIDS